MDMAFLRRAERILEERQPLRLDHALLIAALSAQHTAGVTARPRCEAVQPRPALAEDDPLIEVVLGGPRWREAATRQQGCFNRAEAGRRVNAP
jgi:hypothetical protein